LLRSRRRLHGLHVPAPWTGGITAGHPARIGAIRMNESRRPRQGAAGCRLTPILL
jgi:hypothetical protein